MIMKQLKKLAVVVLSKEQQKKIGGAVSASLDTSCTCPDGTVIILPFNQTPPPLICQFECENRRPC